MSTAFRVSYIDWSYSTMPVAAVSDINGDGKLDLVLNSTGPVYRLGNGDGTFQDNSYPSIGTGYPSSTVIANPDFNADGRIDQLATDTAGYLTLLLAQTGGGPLRQNIALKNPVALDPSVTFGYPSRADTVTNYFVSDLNGDGLPDIVVNASGNQLGRYFSNFYYAEILVNLGESSTISGTTSNQSINDNQTTKPFSAVTITPYGDPLQTLNLTITLSAAAKGVMSSLSGGSYNATTGVYSLSGTAAALTTAIEALVFVPTANHLAPGTIEKTTFTIAVTDAQSRTISDITTSVTVTSVNDAPTVSGAMAGQALKDHHTLHAFADVIIGDVDSPAQPLTVTVKLDDPKKGALVKTTPDDSFYESQTNSVTYRGLYDAATGVYTISGSAAGINYFLNDLVFKPSSDHSSVDGKYTTSFTITANDGISSTVNSVTSVTTTINILDDAPADFFGKGKSDILLQNANTGQCYIWQVDSITVTGSGYAAWTPGASWQAKGTGDFNGDGKSDILLQNSSTGNFYLWEQNGLALANSGQVGPNIPGPYWQERGIGDFNADGKADILFQNANTGDCYIWELNGTTVIGGGPTGPTVGAEWQAKGTGDFNADGKSDILFQNINTGDCYIWEMDQTTVIAHGAAGWTPGREWQVKGTGDFQGDGKSDILLQNANTGDCYLWEMDGTNLIGSGSVGWTPGPEWNAAAIGDYNGDGKSDILLQNINTGACYEWQVNGTDVIGGGTVGWAPGAVWQVKS